MELSLVIGLLSSLISYRKSKWLDWTNDKMIMNRGLLLTAHQKSVLS